MPVQRPSQRSTGGLALFLFAAFAANVLLPDGADAFHSTNSDAGTQMPPLFAEPSHTQATFADIIAFVELYGWPVDLGYLCKSLSLTEAGNKCPFRQIAIHTKTAALDDHGFNVPIDESPPSHVVIYHVTPLAGDFFLVSKDGKLIKAMFRARGADFKPMSDELSVTTFTAEIAFWQRNFAQVEHDVLKSRSNSTPFSGQRQ